MTVLKAGLDACVSSAVQYMGSISAFKYLVRKFPIKVDEQMSSYHLGLMRRNGITAMCTGDYIALNTEQLLKDLNEAELKNEASYAIRDNIITILGHEYNHLLLSHPQELESYQEAGHDELEELSYRMAQDVIANRGIDVLHDPDTIYGKMVTDLALRTHMGINAENIYTVPEIQKLILEWLQENMPQSGSGGASSDNEQSKQQDQNQDGNDGNDGGAGQQNKESQQGESGGSQSEEQSAADAQSFMQKVKASVENTPNFAPRQTVAEMLGIDDDSTDLGENSDGAGGLGHDEDRKPIHELLEKYNNKYEQKQIRQGLSKLRGIIQGDLGKTKTKSYSRPPRRTNEGDLLKKGEKRDRRSTPSVLVALDSSGSMHETEVTSVATAIDAIVKQLGRNISNCYICLHDGQVSHVNKLKDWRKTVEVYYPHGGNNFSNVYKLAKEKGCKVVLNVGDGEDRVTVVRGSMKRELEVDGSILWYDVLVSSSQPEAFHGFCQTDERKGLKRRTIDLFGNITPAEFLPSRDVQYFAHHY